ncbi:MAG: hypothetical protein UHU19_05925 [Lachnospiraceae bacterium]|nr:hypothetical protein [Lachnospiraceae bacterium]
MNRAIFRCILYAIALIIILVEPDFTLLIGALWLLISVFLKIKDKPVATFKIKKNNKGKKIKIF